MDDRDNLLVMRYALASHSHNMGNRNINIAKKMWRRRVIASTLPVVAFENAGRFVGMPCEHANLAHKAALILSWHQSCAT
jgi:hypothetical protein